MNPYLGMITVRSFDDLILLIRKIEKADGQILTLRSDYDGADTYRLGVDLIWPRECPEPPPACHRYPGCDNGRDDCTWPTCNEPGIGAG